MSIGLELDEAFQNTSPFTDGSMSTSPFPNFGKNVSVIPESTYGQNEIEDDRVLEEDHRVETPGTHLSSVSSVSPVTMIPAPTTEAAAPPSPVVRAQPVPHQKQYVPNVPNFAQEERVRETFSKDNEPGQSTHKTKRSSNDFLKSILFSLMILLGISAHAFVAFLFENYVTSTGNYSIKQEVGMRLLYPVTILLIIYLVKNYR